LKMDKNRYSQVVSLDGVTKDVGTLCGLFFDHSSFMDGEIKNFTLEFELKRQDNDFKALKYLTEIVVDLGSNINNYTTQINSMDSVPTKANTSKELLSGVLSKEAIYQEARDSVRRSKALAEDEERKKN